MSTIQIQKATTNDTIQLQKIGCQTFEETFTDTNSAENLQQYLTTNFATEKVNSELQNPNSEFYFALDSDAVIGYLKINTAGAQTEINDPNALEIERIYVLQSYHGKKVGQLLYDKAIQLAKQKKVHYVWLGVWEHNQRAIAFYQKNGFVAFDKHIFIVGNDPQTDIMMKLQLL